MVNSFRDPDFKADDTTISGYWHAEIVGVSVNWVIDVGFG